MAPRRPPPSTPERPFHTVEQKRQDIVRLQRRIDELDAFDPQTVTKRFSDPKVTEIQTAIDETLAAVFGHGTVEYGRYSDAKELDHGPVIMNMTPDWMGARGGGGGYPDEAGEARRYVVEGKQQALSLLRQAVRGLEEEIELAPALVPSLPVGRESAKSSRKVFVVHGHEGEPREAVAGFLRKIDFTPVILHEQSNQGRTIVEKFEAHAGVDFAVVLLTPDDVGGPKGGAQQPRARQNVILELGYFIGKLGRQNVCAIKHGDLEIPSDIIGVVWTPFDALGAWKTALAKELNDAGHKVDWNKVMGP